MWIGTIVFAAICTALFVVTPVAAAPQWSARGVFVFGPKLIDFQQKLETFGSAAAPLSDCSSTELYCARGVELKLVLPRTCASLQAGRSWSSGDITTRLLTVTNDREANEEVASLLQTDVYAFATEGRPYMVFIYTRTSSVVEIFYDPLHEQDFAKLVMADGIKALRPLARYRLLMVTVDQFGPCS